MVYRDGRAEQVKIKIQGIKGIQQWTHARYVYKGTSKNSRRY